MNDTDKQLTTRAQRKLERRCGLREVQPSRKHRSGVTETAAVRLCGAQGLQRGSGLCSPRTAQ